MSGRLELILCRRWPNRGRLKLRDELERLFRLGGLTLRIWKASQQRVLASIPEDVVDPMRTQEIRIQNDYTKVLVVEWTAESDCFCMPNDLLARRRGTINEARMRVYLTSWGDVLPR